MISTDRKTNVTLISGFDRAEYWVLLFAFSHNFLKNFLFTKIVYKNFRMLFLIHYMSSDKFSVDETFSKIYNL